MNMLATKECEEILFFCEILVPTPCFIDVRSQEFINHIYIHAKILLIKFYSSTTC